MLQYFFAWLAVTVTFLIVDGIWLGFVARDFYRRQLGALMRDDVWFAVAGIFYLVYTVTVVVLVVVPAYKAGAFVQSVLLGGLLGLCAYGTYDITNLATLKGWPITAAIVDISWGTFLTAVISGVGYLVMTWVRTP